MRVVQHFFRKIGDHSARRSEGCRGFTFVELMIVFGLSAIVIGLIMSFWVFWQRVFTREALVEGAVHQDVRLTMQELINDLRNLHSFTEFRDGYISFSRFSAEGTGRNRVTVSWEVGTDDEGKPVMRRIQGRDEKKWIGRAGEVLKINPDIFTGYTQNIRDHSFSIFDTRSHDTAHLSRITMVRIKLEVLPAGINPGEEQEKNVIKFRTRVALRYVHNRLVQPYWKF